MELKNSENTKKDEEPNKDFLNQHTRNSSKVHPIPPILNQNPFNLKKEPSNLDSSPLLEKAFSLHKTNTLNFDNNSLHFKINIAKNLAIVTIDVAFNTLGVINLIIMSYHRLNYLQNEYINVCYVIELIMLSFFIIEFLIHLYKIRTNGLSANILIEMMFIILLIFQIIWMILQSPFLANTDSSVILINVIRSLRIFKIKNFLVEVKKSIYPDDYETEDVMKEVTYFVLNNIINVISALFVQATLFLSLDYWFDMQGYSKQRSPYEFEYISSFYFSIINLTTIGYGDIFPITVTTRLVQIAILLLNISVVSMFLGRLSELIYQISPYSKHYKCREHLIIIGELPVSFLRYFLLELQEIDKIQVSLFKLGNVKKLKNILIIGKKEPTMEIKMLLSDQIFGFELNYLQDNMLSKKWYKLSNLQKAKHIFMFSLNTNENEHDSTQKDLDMIAMAKRIELEINIKMSLVLSTDMSENFHKSFSSNVTIISHRLLNNQILANSLENQGFNTWLTHLMTLREKNIPFVSDSSASGSKFFRLFEYAKSMTQEIYPIKFSEFFYGKTFNEAAKLLYFCKQSLEKGENEDLHLDEELNSAELMKNKKYSRKYPILLIGVEEENDNSKTQRRNLLLNPINYKIKEGDIAYVISQNRSIAIKIINQFSTRSKSFQSYQRMQNLYEEKQLFTNNLEEMNNLYENLLERNNHGWDQKIPCYSDKKDGVFDLNFGNSVQGFFHNHIIIKGSLIDFRNIIKIIRFYSDRPVLIFSENEVDYSKWNKIRETYRNVYYVKGIQHSLNHIKELDPKNAHKILIMSETKDFIFQDTDSIVFARILLDFFKIRKVLIELVDESMIRFLEIRPKFDIFSKKQEISFFWPSFVSGNIHYSSLLMSIAARSLYNPNWIFLLKELSLPKIYKDSDLNDDKIIKENSTLCMLKITKEMETNIVRYGNLQYLFMSHEPCIIALALFKKRKNNKFVENKEFNAMKKNIKEIEILNEIRRNQMSAMNTVYGTKFFLTNPTFYTKIKEGDKVLVIGMNNMYKKFNENMNTLGIYEIEKMRRLFHKRKSKISILKAFSNQKNSSKKKNTLKINKEIILKKINPDSKFNSPLKKNTELSISIEEIQRKKMELNLKMKFKENIFDVIKNLNESMKKSMFCYDLLIEKENLSKN